MTTNLSSGHSGSMDLDSSYLELGELQVLGRGKHILGILTNIRVSVGSKVGSRLINFPSKIVPQPWFVGSSRRRLFTIFPPSFSYGGYYSFYEDLLMLLYSISRQSYFDRNRLERRTFTLFP